MLRFHSSPVFPPKSIDAAASRFKLCTRASQSQPHNSPRTLAHPADSLQMGGGSHGRVPVGLTLVATLCAFAGSAAAVLAPTPAAASWMSDYSTRSFGELVIPGTHDSATRYLSSELLPDDGQLPKWVRDAIRIAEAAKIPIDQLVRRWAKAQSLDVGEQLERGVRYVDLRAGWDKPSGAWKIHHALTGQLVDEVLEQVKVFLTKHTSEVVIVELSHFFGKPSEDDVERLAQATQEIFGELVKPFNGDTASLYSMKIGTDFVAKNQRVLVVFEDDAVGAKYSFWPGRTLTNTYADTDDPRRMYAFNREVVMAFNDKETFREDALLKLSWTLTTQAQTILASLNIFENNPHSLLELAAWKANPGLSHFIAEASLYHCSIAHIIVIDDLEHSNLLDAVLALNGRGMEEKGECLWHAHNERSFEAIEDYENERFDFWITSE